MGRGFCKLLEELTDQQIRMRRQAAVKTEQERRYVRQEVEQVSIKACSGQEAKACGSFKYLGTTLSPSTQAMEEVTADEEATNGPEGQPAWTSF